MTIHQSVLRFSSVEIVQNGFGFTQRCCQSQRHVRQHFCLTRTSCKLSQLSRKYFQICCGELTKLPSTISEWIIECTPNGSEYICRFFADNLVFFYCAFLSGKAKECTVWWECVILKLIALKCGSAICREVLIVNLLWSPWWKLSISV